MRVVVTGGCGFIGSHLVERLVADGDSVTVVDSLRSGRVENLAAVRGDVEVLAEDIRADGAWQKAVESCDLVFHLAALADIVPSIQDPTEYFSTNVSATVNIVEVAKRNETKVVYAASSSCYGIPDDFPTAEGADIRPEYPYALTKRLGEEVVLHWSKVYGFSALSLRLFNVYGPRSRTSGAYGAVMGVFLAQKLAGKPLTIVGDGNQTRDFTFVTDVAGAFVAAGKSNVSGEVYNVGSGATTSVNRLAALIGGDIVNIPRRPGEPDATFADISRIKAELGWQPRIGIEEGVAEMLGHIDLWRSAPVWTPESIAVATEDWFKYLGGGS
jgi:UDP-glucose 4-epimerase